MEKRKIPFFGLFDSLIVFFYILQILSLFFFSLFSDWINLLID